jgi:2-polyprenyl-3-methyl-5-hydroxy-6-metoxy-1,4-benzoquinol methylase
MHPSCDYSGKPVHYFAGARRTFVDDLPHNPGARLLEIGCGNGDTAAYALATGKCGWNCGVELCEIPAQEARKKMNQVIVGNVETVELDFPEGHFDILIMSEVLEHLVDPWAALRRLRPLMKRGALACSGSPNVCHHSVLRTLLRGQWQYENRGIFDATHLRWFSPTTYRDLFEGCGFRVDFVGPAAPLRFKARMFNALTMGRFQYLLHSQIYLKAHCEDSF